MRLKGLSGNALKVIAIVAMTVDHLVQNVVIDELFGLKSRWILKKNVPLQEISTAVRNLFLRRLMIVNKTSM